MSVAYRAVQWNRQKRRYDLALAAGCVLWIGAFLAASLVWHPEGTMETALLRAFGTLAIALLHVVLSIGPLARLDARFLPLLYNRRHLGVVTFLVAMVHAVVAILQFHVLGVLDPLTSILASNPRWDSLSQLPFQPLGLAALGILFLMAATSHDFWLVQLGPIAWKTLHMAVYLAWLLVLGHVAFGVLQVEQHPLLVGLLIFGAVWIVGLHSLAAWRERARDAPIPSVSLRRDPEPRDWIEIGQLEDLPAEGLGCTVSVGGERVAIFRLEGRLSALSNVCRHQNGPLGEGRIVDGCIVCPWHGYQYRPHDGASPPPFTETVPTFRLALDGDRVLLDPRPLPAGTPVEPVPLPAGTLSAETARG